MREFKILGKKEKNIDYNKENDNEKSQEEDLNKSIDEKGNIHNEEGFIVDNSGHVIKKWRAIAKLLLLLIIVIGIPLYIYFANKDIIDSLSSVEQLESLLTEYSLFGYLILIGLQIIQIVISFLPGQWIQIAGSYAWGFGVAAGLSIIGTALGTVITYYMSKLLGKDALFLFFGKKKMDNVIELLNSKKAMIFVAVIYFIPGLPKDLCNYAAGISSMNLRMFLIISLIARTPPMLVSILVGEQLAEGNYTAVIIIAVIMAIIFAFGAIYRKKVYDFIDKIYEKLRKKGKGEGYEQNNNN